FVRHANTSLSSLLECSRREVWQCNRAAVVSFTSRCQRLDCKPALGARGRVLSSPYRMRCRSRFFPPASTVGQQVYWGEQPRDQFRSQRILGLVEVLPRPHARRARRNCLQPESHLAERRDQGPASARSAGDRHWRVLSAGATGNGITGLQPDQRGNANSPAKFETTTLLDRCPCPPGGLGAGFLGQIPPWRRVRRWCVPGIDRVL